MIWFASFYDLRWFYLGQALSILVALCWLGVMILPMYKEKR